MFLNWTLRCVDKIIISKVFTLPWEMDGHLETSLLDSQRQGGWETVKGNTEYAYINTYDDVGVEKS